MDFDKIDEGHVEGSQELHFFYNREERLKKAPQIVQDYYSGKFSVKRGFFKVLVGNKGNRFLLISLVLFIAFVWAFTFFSNRNYTVIDSIVCELKAFSYEEEVFVSLELKESKEKTEELKNVKVIFNAIESSGVISQTSSEFLESYSGVKQFIRTKFNDYDIIKVVACVTIDNEEEEVSVVVERR